MNKYDINRRKKRTINGIIKSMRKEILVKYFFSFSFFYMIIFASIHYFLDDDSIFLNTFGVVIIEIITNFIYYTLFVQQAKRDEINSYYENKKKKKSFTVPLIDKMTGENGTVSGFKMILFFIISLIIVTYYFIFGNIIGGIEFMSISNALDYVVFFISIAYFDVFWEGGIKKFHYNIKGICYITKNDKICNKIFLYILLCAVAIYQFYTFISDIIGLINL